MKWPRKGILIRLAIYLPVLGFLSYQAFTRREQGEGAKGVAPMGTVRELKGPNGKDFKVIEVTPEQAEAMGVKAPSD